MKARSAAITLALALALAPAVFAQEANPDWEVHIENALSARTSYEFNEIALGDVVRLLSDDAEVNIILDDGRFTGIDRARKITVKLKDMTYASVLSWVTRLVGLEWTVQDEAILITTYDRLDGPARLRIEKRRAERRVRAARTWLPAVQEVLDRQVSLSFKQKSLADCRDSLAALLGLNFIISPALDDNVPVSLSVSKMTAENLISWVTRKAGADFTVVDEAVFFAASEEVHLMRLEGLDLSSKGGGANLVSFSFHNTPLDAALAELGSKSKMNVVLQCEMAQLPRVTLSANDMPLIEAVQAVTNASGLNNAIIPGIDAIVVRVIKPAPAPVAAPVTEAKAAETPAGEEPAPPEDTPEAPADEPAASVETPAPEQ